jgi:hypothetical protein
MMVRRRSILSRQFLFLLACVLICAVFVSELPEDLTLTNDTSNDYTLRPPTFLRGVQTLSVAKQDAGLLLTSVPRPAVPQTWSVVAQNNSPLQESLFILHSVLRR